MQCHVVGGLIVDTFDDVYLTPGWPLRSECPECWPCATTNRHVSQVDDDKAMIVALLAFKSDTVPASTRRDICVINADVHDAVVGIDETVVLCRRLIDVVDISLGWIVGSIEVEHREEIRHIVIVHQGIASYTQVYQSSRDKECREAHVETNHKDSQKANIATDKDKE